MGLQQTFIRVNELAYPHYYLCNYLPVSAGKDNLSHSLLKFKRGEDPHPDAWIDCSIDILEAGRPISPGAIIVRALHHDETMAAGSASLDRLGRALASRFRCRYAPTLLQKSRLTRPIKGLTRQQRETELQSLYYIGTASPDYAAFQDDPLYPGLPAVSQRPILVIDDILTTATTVKMIIGAILTHFPRSPITVFTLAKADYDGSSNQSTALKGQNYQLGQGMDWIIAEDPAPYYSIHQLKTWIRSGSF